MKQKHILLISLFVGCLFMFQAVLLPRAFADNNLGSTDFTGSSHSCPTGQLHGTFGEDSGSKTCCPRGSEDDAGKCLFAKYVNPLVNLFSALVGVAVVASIVYGGIQYSSAGGDPGKVQAAKDRIRNAIFALIVFFFLYALLQWMIPGGL